MSVQTRSEHGPEGPRSTTGARSSTVERWATFEWSAPVRQAGDEPEATVRATFTCGPRSIGVDGFHDGAGVYRVRFMPDAEGEWRFRVSSSSPELDGASGSFQCSAPGPANHGVVQVSEVYHFAYADGSPYRPFGTTCYAWIHQPDELQRQTLETLRRSPFNKLRMCVFPKHYAYNVNEPELHPFLRGVDGQLDFDRPDAQFFRHLEARIEDLRDLGIEADIILFHPYDRWGYARMTAGQDERYLRYVIARLGACRNVWWSLANEFDLMDKSAERWEALFQVVHESDPYRHLTSIHNADRMFDHGRPEISHVSVQAWDVKRTRQWRDTFRKPIVNDEPEYEGDIPWPWGNISAQELVHRFWVTATNGGYAGHGETYLDDQDVLWWSKGGRLKGEAPARIAFLRRILDEAPGPLEPVAPSWVWTRVSAATGPGFWLYYFGEHQPRIWSLGLPTEAGEYTVELIDPWAMEVMPVSTQPAPPVVRLPGTQEGPGPAFSVELPGRPYLALRVRRV